MDHTIFELHARIENDGKARNRETKMFGNAGAQDKIDLFANVIPDALEDDPVAIFKLACLLVMGVRPDIGTAEMLKIDIPDLRRPGDPEKEK